MDSRRTRREETHNLVGYFLNAATKPIRTPMSPMVGVIHAMKASRAAFSSASSCVLTRAIPFDGVAVLDDDAR
ncbi:MAG: hypothetical protein K2Z25_19365 [Beijerinckiaceae bacterium]|nr:hypothetical protein [Beijerinckiaceae bacterium]